MVNFLWIGKSSWSVSRYYPIPENKGKIIKTFITQPANVPFFNQVPLKHEVWLPDYEVRFKKKKKYIYIYIYTHIYKWKSRVMRIWQMFLSHSEATSGFVNVRFSTHITETNAYFP